MLLYICTIWSNSNKKLKEDILKTKVLFWDQVWELMRRTHNLKYPTEKITKEGLAQTKRKLAEFAEGKKDEEMSFDKFYEWFGEEKGLDLFYFGVYSIEEMETPPWEEEAKDGVAVAPTYGVSIQDMLENECEEIGQEKEEARRKEEEKEKKRKEDDEKKKRKEKEESKKGQEEMRGQEIPWILLLLGLAVGLFAIWKN